MRFRVDREALPQSVVKRPDGTECHPWLSGLCRDIFDVHVLFATAAAGADEAAGEEGAGGGNGGAEEE